MKITFHVWNLLKLKKTTVICITDLVFIFVVRCPSRTVLSSVLSKIIFLFKNYIYWFILFAKVSRYEVEVFLSLNF